ncbi:hypothetical protein [Streptomyces sp. H27-D2]|uniref:hypothetical protein n=1 Tax=Streptomyces sp. H27-D2 TaxID=3046304 RepID=UPI002DC01357|nr:hypothetical protein [Streptomyces sp. H27-D2]MEC4015070.1 hypothetical protein [Streptomyces sp. H27-D2]
MDAEPAEPEKVAAKAGTAVATAQVMMPSPSVAITAEVAKAVAEAPEEPGNLTRLILTPLGNRPYKATEVVPAWWRLRSTHDSVSGLFDTLHLVRRTRAAQNNKTTRGRLHSDAQDLLRAAIVFTSAGLDATVQALIHRSVPVLIAQPGNPRLKYETFIDQQTNAPNVGEEFLAALKEQDPSAALLDLYVVSKTKASFQGSSDLRNRAGASLGITNQQIPKARFTALDSFFTARNDVAHRLDMENVSLSTTKPLTKIRAQQDVLQMCDQALLLVRELIKETAVNLAACR